MGRCTSLSPGPMEYFKKLKAQPGDYPIGLIVGSVEIVGCRYTTRYDCYVYKLANPKRLRRPFRPKNRPQPVWFHPIQVQDQAYWLPVLVDGPGCSTFNGAARSAILSPGLGDSIFPVAGSTFQTTNHFHCSATSATGVNHMHDHTRELAVGSFRATKGRVSWEAVPLCGSQDR